MPNLWLDPDELKALQDVFDWKRRIGVPVDWAAYDRAKARIINHPSSDDPPAETTDFPKTPVTKS